MNDQVFISLFAEAVLLVILMASVLVIPGLLVGLIISMFQAATQINEQTLSFLPRLLTMLAALLIAGPWLLTRLTDFYSRLLTNIPMIIG